MLKIDKTKMMSNLEALRLRLAAIQNEAAEIKKLQFALRSDIMTAIELAQRYHSDEPEILRELHNLLGQTDTLFY